MNLLRGNTANGYNLPRGWVRRLEHLPSCRRHITQALYRGSDLTTNQIIQPLQQGCYIIYNCSLFSNKIPHLDEDSLNNIQPFPNPQLLQLCLLPGDIYRFQPVLD